MSADREINTDATNENNLVRPKVEFCSLLQHAGATKDVFTMKEVMFYLGRYIMQKQLYDQKQQHMVHCAQDALGRVLGVDSFSVKEPRVLFAMITKNLVAVNNKDSASDSGESASSRPDRGSEVAETESRSSSLDRRRRRRRSHRSSDPGPSQSVEEEDEAEEEEEEEGEGRKRRRSDSYSLTFDDSLSWCVIGGLVSGRDRQSSQSSSSESTSERSEVTAAPSESDSDNFSVEFEVESIDSDDYGEDDASLSADDQVYEVTIFEADDEDSFDEDTEITEADYWRCSKCDELNPPLPRNCLRCWDLRQDWLPNQSANAASSPKALPTKPNNQSDAKDAPGCDVEDAEGVDVPDGKRTKSSPSSLREALDSRVAALLFLTIFRRQRAPPLFAYSSSSPSVPPRAGAQRVGGVAPAGLVPGPVPHLSVAAQKRLHRPRTDGSPDVLLRLRPQAEEEEQAVSGLQDAHPVRGPHLPELRRRLLRPHLPQLTHLQPRLLVVLGDGNK
uniref:MDM2 proto-oncogene n=1 Tax=Oryzias sinensis TaxID=183150 RepID=A0A8C8DXY8_9TELE